MGKEKDITYDDTKPFKFTEKYIQNVLNGFFAVNSQRYSIENLYVYDWWESDKLIQTRSGLFYEFEIKVSRSDFKNDFKNKPDKHIILEGKEEFLPSYGKILDENKHIWEKYYRVADKKKPNFFYYAVPEGLIDETEVPEYAGLIYVLPEGEKKTRGGEWCDGFYIVKKAPKLHNEKYSDEELNLAEKFYYNMETWKKRYDKENERRLITEEDHKIPYAELLEKYEAVEKEKKALLELYGIRDKTTKLLTETMEQDRHIIRAYRMKMKELNPDFDAIEFEDEILEKYQ